MKNEDLAQLEPKVEPINDTASCSIKQELMPEPFDPNQPVNPNFTEYSVVIQYHGEDSRNVSRRLLYRPIFIPSLADFNLPFSKTYASVAAGGTFIKVLPTKTVVPKPLPSLPTVDEMPIKPSTTMAVSLPMKKEERPPGWQLVRKRRGSGNDGELERPRSKTMRPHYDTDIVCLECNKTFGRQGGLVQHMQSKHSGPLPYHCGPCGKRFQQEAQLEKHLARHNMTDKPHKCDVEGCDRQFVHKNDLTRHVQGSHGEARFACSECERRFVRHDHLLLHEQGHERKRQRAAHPELFVKRGRKKRVNVN